MGGEGTTSSALQEWGPVGRIARRNTEDTMNKRKKVAWHKHLQKAKKAEAKRKDGRGRTA